MDTIVVEQEEFLVEIDEEASLVQIEETGIQIITIGEQGPAGPTGLTGPQGPPGSASTQMNILGWVGL